VTRASTIVVSLLLAVFALRVSAASFFSNNSFNYPAGTNPISIAVADVNLDGWPDIVMANANDPELWVLTNKADGTFAPAPRIPATTCVKIIAQDVNGDARPDLLLLRNSGATFVYTNAGGSFTFASSNALNFVDVEGFAIADLDGDGWVELLTVMGGPIHVFTNDHRGAFTFSAYAFANGFYPWAIVPADFNHDSHPDLLVSHWEDRPVIMTNNGSGVLSFARFIDGYGGPVLPRAADMNHDGLADCFFDGNLLTNNGSGTFTAAHSSNSILALADLDGDGWTEIVTLGRDVRTNNHFNVFSKRLKLGLPASPNDIAIADLDKNGRPDVITVNGLAGSPGSVSVVLQYAQLALAIRPDGAGGNGLLLQWLATDPPMYLEVTNRLGPVPANWSPVPSYLNAAGTHYEIVRPATAPMEFFRLHD
jgi:hypothetical protein